MRPDKPARRPQCDDVDRKLIGLLVRDVRATNRELASATGLSEWTVANRLRRLREEHVLAATLVVDWKLAGYEVSGFALIRVQGHDTGAVARSLQNFPDIQSVACTLGATDIVVHMLARDLPALRETADRLGEIAGIAGVELLTIAGYHRYVLDAGPVPLDTWNPDELNGTALELDGTDRRLMRCLIEDGHESNREIARQLEVSENMIRSRLRRLLDSGLVRIIAMFDPFALGEAQIAYFALRCRGRRRREILEHLGARKEIPALTTCLGRFDIVGVAVGASLDDIVRLLDEVRRSPGVDELLHLPIVGTPRYRFHLAKLL